VAFPDFLAIFQLLLSSLISKIIMQFSFFFITFARENKLLTTDMDDYHAENFNL